MKKRGREGGRSMSKKKNGDFFIKKNEVKRVKQKERKREREREREREKDSERERERERKKEKKKTSKSSQWSIFLRLEQPASTLGHVDVVSANVADMFHQVHFIWIPEICVGGDALGLRDVAANVAVDLCAICNRGRRWVCVREKEEGKYKEEDKYMSGISVCVCVCVCMCAWQKKKERQEKGEKKTPQARGKKKPKSTNP